MKVFLNRIRGLRQPVRSLLYLYWIGIFIFDIMASFLQIAVFKMFSDVSVNIAGAIFSYTGIMLGFCIFGYIASRFQLNAKQGFYYSFIFCAVGILILAVTKSAPTAYLALFINGAGNGFFWLTLHTYELAETKDTERDFYSSLLTSGRSVISIFSPLFATTLIWLSLYVFNFSSFALLFTVTPLFYLLGLFCFKGIRTYVPERIELEDVKHFLFDKKNILAQLYIGSNGASHILAAAITPVAIFYILGTELRFGIYSTLVSILTILIVLVLGHYRNDHNRLLLYGVSSFGISLILVLLGYHLTFYVLVIVTIINTILTPIMQVSDHVISLQTMESIGRVGRDFYATMILRDFSLWFWRMIIAFVLLFLSTKIQDTATVISLGLYMLAACVLLSFVGAFLLVRKMRSASN